MKQMLQLYERAANNMIAVQTIPYEDTKSYGIVSVSELDGQMVLPMPGFTIPIQSIVEKPHPSVAPSNLAVVGRYVFNPLIFRYLESTQPGAGGEIQLTDAISEMLKLCQVDAYNFMGERFDCGSKLGYLQATVAMGMGHPEIGQMFKEYLKRL